MPAAVSDQSSSHGGVSVLLTKCQRAQLAAAFGSAILGIHFLLHWEAEAESRATCIYADGLSDGGGW